MGNQISQSLLQTSAEALFPPRTASPSTAFGHALRTIGLTQGSSYNPSNSTDNCVFVTLAYLLGKTADELSSEVAMAMPENGSGGLPISRLRPLFERIDWVVRNKRIEVAFYNGGFPNSPDNTAIGQKAKFLDVNQRVGIGYVRPGGGGHVAVMERRPEGGYQYKCFQHSGLGRDVSGEVDEKNIRFSFCPYDY